MHHLKALFIEGQARPVSRPAMRMYRESNSSNNEQHFGDWREKTSLLTGRNLQQNQTQCGRREERWVEKSGEERER